MFGIILSIAICHSFCDRKWRGTWKERRKNFKALLPGQKREGRRRIASGPLRSRAPEPVFYTGVLGTGWCRGWETIKSYNVRVRAGANSENPWLMQLCGGRKVFRTHCWSVLPTFCYTENSGAQRQYCGERFPLPPGDVLSPDEMACCPESTGNSGRKA